MDKYLLTIILTIGLIFGFIYALHYERNIIYISTGSFSFASITRFSSLIILWGLKFFKNKILVFPIFFIRGVSIGFLSLYMNFLIIPWAVIFIFSYFFIISKYETEKKEYLTTLLMIICIITFLNVLELAFLSNIVYNNYIPF